MSWNRLFRHSIRPVPESRQCMMPVYPTVKSRPFARSGVLLGPNPNCVGRGSFVSAAPNGASYANDHFVRPVAALMAITVSCSYSGGATGPCSPSPSAAGTVPLRYIVYSVFPSLRIEAYPSPKSRFQSVVGPDSGQLDDRPDAVVVKSRFGPPHCVHRSPEAAQPHTISKPIPTQPYRIPLFIFAMALSSSLSLVASAEPNPNVALHGARNPSGGMGTPTQSRWR